jgi:hypothetical protein
MRAHEEGLVDVLRRPNASRSRDEDAAPGRAHRTGSRSPARRRPGHSVPRVLLPAALAPSPLHFHGGEAQDQLGVAMPFSGGERDHMFNPSRLDV